MRKLARSAAAAAVALLGACASLHDSPRPAFDVSPSMPGKFTEAAAPNAVLLTQDWWRGFQSTELASLVETALVENPDMAIAAERIVQAEAQVRVANASLFPALNLGADTGRRESRPPGGPWRGDNSSSVGLSASYEVDLWGGNRAGVRAAEWSLNATRFDRETIRLTLVTGVANGYFQLLSLRGRLTVARENLATAERVLTLVEARERNGAVTPLDLARQRAATLSQRASIPPLELQERQTLYALAILTGRKPEQFGAAGAQIADLAIPRVAPGLPTDLLVRRPDLASAEAQLVSANANVQTARAALLPRISLTGSAGLASGILINVLNAPTAALSLGAALAQPIFDAGRLRAQVDIAASRERELVEAYRRAILAALADVEGALAAGGRTADQEVLQLQVVVQAREALRISEVRYREGVDDLLTVLDAQRTLFQAEDQVAQVRLARLQASVSLYKALGGGWG
ncbi:MAG: efflux transporter outer membrane subunit [Betaproteobacteria bacterium]